MFALVLRPTKKEINHDGTMYIEIKALMHKYEYFFGRNYPEVYLTNVPKTSK